MNMLDFGQIIAEVKERPLLWDRDDADRCNRTKTEPLWEEIADKLGCDKIQCKKKWKSAKDQYRRIDKQYSTKGRQPVWQYYEEMSFVKDHMRSQKLRENFVPKSKPIYKLKSRTKESEPTNCDTSDENLETNEKESTQSDSDYLSPNEQPIDEDMKLKNMRFVGNNNNERSESNISDDEQTDDNESSDDLLFFNSLLSFMKEFTPAEKLKIRNQIQSTILDELNNSSSPSSSPVEVLSSQSEDDSDPLTLYDC